MKAKNTNGNIIVYSDEQFKTQFNNYNLKDGSNVILFYLSDKIILESEGFFDVVVPGVLEGERLGLIYFDEENKVFTYPVELIPAKTPEEIAAEIENEIQYQKQLQYQELQPTDWYFIRRLETGAEIPLEVLEQRQAIREKYNS